MSSNVFAEVARCANEFAPVQAVGASLQLKMTALIRDFGDLDQKLSEALSQGEDVGPILQEICDLSLENAGVLDALSVNAAESAALCRQSAKAVKKLAR